MDTEYQSAVGSGGRISSHIHLESACITRMVYCHIRVRNLSPEPIHRIFDAENGSCTWSGWYVIVRRVIRDYCCSTINLIHCLFIHSFADEQGPELPTRSNEEFRPFIRRLPEFKFWYAISKSTVIAIVCTFFEVFNIPVFWPILVMYFITLFCITMKRQIKVCVWQKSLMTSTNLFFVFFFLSYLCEPYFCSIWSNTNTCLSPAINHVTRMQSRWSDN